MKLKKLSRSYTLVAVIIWICYVGVSLLNLKPESMSKYHLTPVTYMLLLVSLLVPLLIIWLFAVSGWIRFWDFTRKVPEGSQRTGFLIVSLGLFVLVIDLIVPSLIRTTFTFFGGNIASPTWVIINNYMSTLLPLASFALLFAGSSVLVSRTRHKVPLASKVITAGIPVALFSVFYIYMIFTNPIRQVSTDAAIPATYYMPDILIIATIILPVIVTWILGLLLVLNLKHYSHYTSTVNRRGLSSFYNGIVVIVGATILAQALNSVGASRFNGFNLGLVLILLYILLGLITFGFALIAHGAKRLEKPTKQQDSSG